MALFSVLLFFLFCYSGSFSFLYFDQAFGVSIALGCRGIFRVHAACSQIRQIHIKVSARPACGVTAGEWFTFLLRPSELHGIL